MFFFYQRPRGSVGGQWFECGRLNGDDQFHLHRNFIFCSQISNCRRESEEDCAICAAMLNFRSDCNFMVSFWNFWKKWCTLEDVTQFVLLVEEAFQLIDAGIRWRGRTCQSLHEILIKIGRKFEKCLRFGGIFYKFTSRFECFYFSLFRTRRRSWACAKSRGCRHVDLVGTLPWLQIVLWCLNYFTNWIA